MGTDKSHMTTVYRMICYGNRQSYDCSIQDGFSMGTDSHMTAVYRMVFLWEQTVI